MFQELILFIAKATLLATLGLILSSLIKCQLAYWSFKRKTNNLPIIAGRQLIGNHVISVPLMSNLCPKLAKMHESQGKTIGYLHNDNFLVSTIDLNLIKLFIYDEPNEHINRTRLNLPISELENSMMLVGDDKWRKLRRHFAPALKSNKFKAPNVIAEIELSISKLIDQIELKLRSVPKPVSEGKEFQIDELVHKYSLNLVFSCFYKQDNLIDFNDDNCNWTKTVDEGLNAIQTSPFVRISFLFPVLRSTIDWLIWNFHPQGKWRQSMMHFVKLQAKLGFEARKEMQEMQKNKKPGEQLNLDNFVLKDGTKFKRNMMDTVVDHFLDGKLTRDEFFDTSCFLVNAADRTAADAIVHTLYLLGRHQNVQEKLRQSIQVDGIESEYLAWVINESLRLLPPAPIGCTRTVTRDIRLDDGKIVPANTLVVTSAYVIHRLKEYWGEDAEEFRPDRWQDASKFHPCQFIPFGAGIRGCPGKEFALFEMKMLFVALLTRYKFECKHKEDLYTFDSPIFMFVIPNSHTYITIKRL